AGKWAVDGKENWTPYRAYLLIDLRTTPPFKRSQSPQTGLHRCQGEIFRPPGTASLGVRRLNLTLGVRRPPADAVRKFGEGDLSSSSDCG
ncbi:hypothetical protein AVEN_202770-1, partial [Araneus ventricosus]